jgi:hypothetical protein
MVAFVEKLANPDLALHFLAQHPDFNVVQLIGIPMSDVEVVRLAGAIEALVLREHRARRPSADLRRDARHARLRLQPAAAPGRLGAVAMDPPAARLGKGAPRGHARVTPALRHITDPKGHDPRTMNRRPGANLMA